MIPNSCSSDTSVIAVYRRTKYSWTFGLARTEPAVGTSARSVLAESYALLKQNFPRDNTCEEIEQWLAGSNDSIAVHLSRNGIVVGAAAAV